MKTASEKQSGERSTDRVFEALATIAGLLDRTLNEMKTIDSEFQQRLLEAVHDTEASLQSQTTKHLESASAEWESERRTLKAEIERLESALAAAQKQETIAGRLDRTLNEMKAIDTEFQERLLEAVHDTEASLQSQTVKHLKSASAEWESERRTLKAEIERLESALAAAQKQETIAGLLDRALKEMKAIDSEFQERLLEAVHDTEASLQSQTAKQPESASAEWESERRTLKAEIERLESALAAAQKQEIEKSAEPPVNDTAPKSEINDTALKSEIERIENLIKQVSAAGANPGTPMPIVIRKNIERAELEGYLKGIRYKSEAR